MPISLLEHIYIVGTAASIVVAILMALAIFRLSAGNNRHMFLELIFVAFAISVFANTILNVKSGSAAISMIGLTEPFQLLFGPLFYLYLKNLSGVHNPWRKNTLHFIPFLFLTLYLSAFFFGFTRQRFLLSTNAYTVTVSALSFFVYVQLWLYYFLCRIEHKRYRQRLKQSCSEIERLSESWVGDGLLALLLCYSVLGVVYGMNHGAVNLSVNKSAAIIVASLIYFMVFQTLKRPQLFSPESLNVTENSLLEPIDKPTSKTKNDEVSGKYERSGMSDRDAAQHMQRVRAFMQSEKPYLDPELSIGALADQIELNVHHLSQVINSSDGRNFFDFVNGYRIEQVKIEFANPVNTGKTVLEIAMNSGFNSKATFNRIFKKSTGATPSAYRKSSFD